MLRDGYPELIKHVKANDHTLGGRDASLLIGYFPHGEGGITDGAHFVHPLNEQVTLKFVNQFRRAQTLYLKAFMGSWTVVLLVSSAIYIYNLLAGIQIVAISSLEAFDILVSPQIHVCSAGRLQLIYFDENQISYNETHMVSLLNTGDHQGLSDYFYSLSPFYAPV